MAGGAARSGAWAASHGPWASSGRPVSGGATGGRIPRSRACSARPCLSGSDSAASGCDRGGEPCRVCTRTKMSIISGSGLFQAKTNQYTLPGERCGLTVMNVAGLDIGFSRTRPSCGVATLVSGRVQLCCYMAGDAACDPIIDAGRSTSSPSTVRLPPREGIRGFDVRWRVCSHRDVSSAGVSRARRTYPGREGNSGRPPAQPLIASQTRLSRFGATRRRPRSPRPGRKRSGGDLPQHLLGCLPERSELPRDAAPTTEGQEIRLALRPVGPTGWLHRSPCRTGRSSSRNFSHARRTTMSVPRWCACWRPCSSPRSVHGRRRRCRGLVLPSTLKRLEALGAQGAGGGPPPWNKNGARLRVVRGRASSLVR